MLIVYKAARVREYLQENLRVLSAVPGDVVATTYGPRWQSALVTKDPPTPGETAVIVLTDPPYDKLTPVRYATVADSVLNEHGYLRVSLELGAYAHAPSIDAWNQAVTGFGRPGGRPSIFVERAELGRLIESAGDSERAWRRIVERLSRDPHYSQAVFARIASVRILGADNHEPLTGVPQLDVGTSQVVTLVHHNPHLGPAAQAQIRLLPMVDELAASAVMAESRGLDGGSLELLMEPLRPGRGELEVHAIRGTEFLPVAWLTWDAHEPAMPEVEPEQSSPLDVVLESETTAPAGDALLVEAPVLAPISEAMLARQDVAAPLVRAARLVAEALPDAPERRLGILSELREAAGDDPRIVEDIGIALYQAGRAEEAAKTLAAVPLDSLGSESRSVLLAATMVSGALPEPLERLALADWTQPQTFERLIDASAHLPPLAMQRLTEFLIDHLLSEDRSHTWLRAVTARTLPRQVLLALAERWQYVDPDAAARALDEFIDQGRLHLAENSVAQLAYDVAGPAMTGLRMQAARALVDSAARKDDRDGLIRLLGDMRRPERHIHRDEFHDLGEEIIRLIGDITPQDEPIDDALLAAADFIEDHRQAGELDRAAHLAVFVAANRSRAAEATRARVDEVLAELTRAQEASSVFQRFIELQEAEVNLDVRRAVAGLRFLLVGARRGDWFDAMVTELALSDRTEWIESERGKPPQLEPIEAVLKAGRIAGVVLFVSHIAHRTSAPIQKLAKRYEVPYFTCKRPSRDAFLAVLREKFVA